MRKSNIIIKKVRNLMILSMAVIVIISVYFNILNSRAKETTDIVANVTDETGEIDSQKVTLVATGNKNGNYEISLPETISNVYVSNYKTLNGDKSANDKIVLSQDEVENKEINLEVNYDKKNVTSTKTNEEMTLYKQNLEYDDKGIYVEGYMPLLAQINVIQNENDISLEILYTVVESNNMSTKEIYVPSEYEQTLKITLNKKKYGVEQSLISSTDAEYIVVEQSDSKLVINNISSNTINITNEEVPTIILNVEKDELFAYILQNEIQNGDNAFVKGTAFKTLITKYGYNEKDICLITNQSHGQINNLMRILSLPKEIKSSVVKGHLSYAQVRVLLGLSKEQQITLMHKFEDEDISVREAERIAGEFKKSSFYQNVQSTYERNGQTFQIKLNSPQKADEFEEIIKKFIANN